MAPAHHSRPRRPIRRWLWDYAPGWLASVQTLEQLYTGALVHADMGYVTYWEIADRLESSAWLVSA